MDYNFNKGFLRVYDSLRLKYREMPTLMNSDAIEVTVYFLLFKASQNCYKDKYSQSFLCGVYSIVLLLYNKMAMSKSLLPYCSSSFFPL